MKVQYKYKALITDVSDGDTVRAVVDLGFYITKEVKIRLAAIDAAELRSKTDEGKQKALAAKKFLEDRVLNKEVVLKSLKPGKYNERYIGFIYLEDAGEKSVNDEMLEKKLAVPYGKSDIKK